MSQYDALVQQLIALRQEYNAENARLAKHQDAMLEETVISNGHFKEMTVAIHEALKGIQKALDEIDGTIYRKQAMRC